MSEVGRNQEQARTPVIGIDLGTTYSVVAHVDSSGRPNTIPNSMGDLLTPSAVLIDEDDIVIGKEAVKYSVMHPDAFADCFKRDIGSVKFRRQLQHQDVPPEVLSGFLLQRLKSDAEQRLGPIERAVITVPAFFDEGRRTATQQAGRLAGLDVLDIINEPTAAAVAYGFSLGMLGQEAAEQKVGGTRFMVFDFGGGTFDVTILEIEGDTFRAVATDGDVKLGGKDFDERLYNHLAEEFMGAHGLDPRSDSNDAAQLWINAQEAKHTLSERSKATVMCFHAGIRMRIELDRTQFEEMCHDLIERSQTTTSLVIQQAGLTWNDIDNVLLVGGSARIPAIANMLENLSGKRPDRSQSPDEAVAHGAALYAQMLTDSDASSGVGRCSLVNVNSHSLGVVGTNAKTGRKLNVVLIPKNTPLPHTAEKLFRTAKPDQRSVNVPIVEGESERPEACISLGECHIQGLPPGLAGGTVIHVRFHYAADGTLKVSARVPDARQTEEINIQRGGSTQFDSLDQWRRRLCPAMNEAPPVSDPPATGGSVDTTDRASVMRRLDQLYAKVGRRAVECELPQAAARSQQETRAAQQELAAARQALEQAEQVLQTAQSPSEKTRLGAIASKARLAFEQAATHATFTLIVLGRDAIQANVQISGAEEFLREIASLRQHLD